MIGWCLFTLSLIAAASGSKPLRAEVTCTKNAYPPPESNRVPWYTINLDLPATQRWTQLAKDKSAGISTLIQQLKNFVNGFANATEIFNFVDKEGNMLDRSLPAPYADELRGLSSATGIPLGEIVVYNLFYEFFTVCTSIVAQDPSGNYVHARNLDFGLFLGWDIKNRTWEITEYLRPLVVNLNFTKGGKSVYKSVNFAGYIGILTGMRPGVFSLTMNERFNLDGGYIGIIEWLLGRRSGHWMGFLTRDTMENAVDYFDAVKRLSFTKMLAPAYFIVGGNKPQQACVLTRDREGLNDQWNITNRETGGWFILETNYDHFDSPPFFDDRREPAKHCMKKLTQQNVNFPGLFNVLSTIPVRNKLTTYSALMEVNTGAFETWLQYCPEPNCFPW